MNPSKPSPPFVSIAVTEIATRAWELVGMGGIERPCPLRLLVLAVDAESAAMFHAFDHDGMTKISLCDVGAKVFVAWCH